MQRQKNEKKRRMDGFEPRWACKVLISCRFRRYKDLFFFSFSFSCCFPPEQSGLGLTILFDLEIRSCLIVLDIGSCPIIVEEKGRKMDW